MSFSFDASKTQAAGNQPQGTLGFTAATPGAGDAGKLSTGFALGSMQNQPKPGGLFGSTLGGTPSSTFGSPAAGATGLNLGTMPSGTPGMGLTFGGAPTSAPGTLNFGMGGAATTGTGFGATGFGTLGATTAATSTTSALSFGTPKTTQTTGFTLGAAVSTAASAAPKLTFGTPTPTATGFSLGSAATPASTTAAPTTATGFGLAAATPQTGISLGTPASTTGFGLTPSTGVPSLTSAFGQTSVAPTGSTTTASTGFSLSGATTAPSTAFNLGSGTASTISSGFALNKTTTTQATPTTTTTTPQTSLGTVTTVSSASSGQAGAMNFCQLEESINKWTLELEEQEKAFVNQASQVNAWDVLLIANGEKIATLNQEVERVKLEQQQLEHELDYVVGQQKELQDCLVPLEKELASRSVADPERDYTYRLAENLDKQLKQMSQDLKEIIEHLNEANRSQDSSNPIVQIGKILNAHMNSLQWLDQKTTVLAQKIQQIDQMHQNFRQENERSFSLAYN